MKSSLDNAVTTAIPGLKKILVTVNERSSPGLDTRLEEAIEKLEADVHSWLMKTEARRRAARALVIVTSRVTVCNG